MEECVEWWMNTELPRCMGAPHDALVVPSGYRYGMEDEGNEWRKVPAEDLPRLKRANDAARKMDIEAARLQEERELVEATALAAAVVRGGGGTKDTLLVGGKGTKPPSGASAHRFAFGMEVEVKRREKGFEGSWFVHDARALRSRHESFT